MQLVLLRRMSKIFFIICFIFITFCYGIVDSTKVKDPQLAWKYALAPGLGQIYNEQYIKSILFLTAEGYSLYKINQYSDSGAIGNRNTYVWWLFGIYILSIIDAYVEAHLSTFPKKNEIENK